jgi:superfamily I DNA/RNA helicase
MPELIGEMRKDLKCYPLQREFYLKECSIVYNMSGFHLAYFYDDHKNLRQMIRILENHRLVADITATSVERFLISEDFAEFLKSERSPDGPQAQSGTAPDLGHVARMKRSAIRGLTR